MKKIKISQRKIKIDKVSSLEEKLASAKSIAFTDYRGLTVNQISELREKIRSHGGEVLVAKNSLLKRAILKNKLEEPTDLTGPTAVVISYEDEVAPIKAIADSKKTFGLPQFKFGYFGKNLLDVSALESLAKVPSRQVLEANLVGTLVSPLYNIVGVLNANIRNLVSVLDQVAKKQS